jgi:large subunit ribosomal protein L18
MNRLQKKRINQIQRKNRIRAKLHGTIERPRMSVTISNQHISVQLIDDDGHNTLASATTVGHGAKLTGSKTDKAAQIGKEIAAKAKKKKIKAVVLDRNGRLYHGRVKALAEAARQEGLTF